MSADGQEQRGQQGGMVLACWCAEELLLLLPFVSGTEVEDLGTKALVRFLREDPTLTDEPIFLYMPKANTW
jgi:hypothetical protein